MGLEEKWGHLAHCLPFAIGKTDPERADGFPKVTELSRRKKRQQHKHPLPHHAYFLPLLITFMLLTPRIVQTGPAPGLDFHILGVMVDVYSGNKEEPLKRKLPSRICYSLNAETEQIHLKQLGEHYKTIYN